MEEILKHYPFQTVLSLDPLITHLEKRCEDAASPLGVLLQHIEQIQELHGPITDSGILETHAHLLQELLSQVFSPLSWQTEPVGAVVPFTIQPVSVSPLFAKLFLGERPVFHGRLNLRQEDFNFGRVIRAYLFILKQLFNLEEELNYPVIRTVKGPDTGLDRYFRMEPDFRFVQARALTPWKELNQEEQTFVLDHLTEPEKLKELLPPEQFELRGLTMIRAVDVTESEVMSLLQRDLIDQESLTTKTGFESIQNRLRVLFKKPDLFAGIAALEEDQVLLLNTGCEMAKNCIFADSRHISKAEFLGSPYERAAQSGRIVRINDLLEDPWHQEQGEKAGMLGKIRSLLIAPLMYKGECIGTMDLGSAEPGGFGPLAELLLDQLRPIFALTVKKALDELDHQVQGIIKQECTAIHPAVEWRFRKAAFLHLEDLHLERGTKIEPIVFHDIYPLYGVSDIRGSSLERNRAIESDLSEHLNLARHVLLTANQAKPMLILQELILRIEAYQAMIGSGLGQGDDLALIDFLSREVEPLFSLLKGFGPGVQGTIQRYRAAMDPKVGTVYSLRKDYEESLSLLNDSLCLFLDQEEAELQNILPHYFERHKTDGLDYLIYLGDSLLEAGGFHPMYLKNFRIWQIKAACGLGRIAEDLKKSMKVSLDISHLILVQNNPLSIRFRYDEKRFDVDGAYDVRQEIIKSRLDKAEVNGTGERLTQPGKIAIIYSSRKEGLEMKQHIDYLRSEDYLKGETEDLKLADLPGVQGLKSLRVDINLESKALEQRIRPLAA